MTPEEYRELLVVGCLVLLGAILLRAATWMWGIY